MRNFLFLALIVITTIASADTPPIINIWKMGSSGHTGAVISDGSQLYSVAPGTSGNVLTSSGGVWASSPPPSAPVSSVNTQTGAVVLTTSNITEGSNLYFTNGRAIGALPSQTGQSGKVLTTDGSNLSWTSSGGGGSSVWGSITGTLSNQTDLQSALNGKQASLSFTAPLVNSSNTVSCNVASGSQPGCLSSSDWTTFNGKQAAGSYITGLTGDITASGPGNVAATLASTPNKVYVNFLLGSDSSGTGTYLKPWKTLQYAYDHISPSVNGPYTIYTTGGNNDTDTYPITGKTNVNIVAEQGQQMHGITLPDDAQNDGASFFNMIFLDSVNWVSNSIWSRSVGFYNVEFFSGPDIEQNGSGQSFVVAQYSLFTNSTFGLTAGGVMENCQFYGSTTFKDMPTTYFGYLDLQASYNIGAMSISGAVNPVYLSGFVQDVPFGASMTFVTTANGTPAVEADSAGLPPSYTGSPTITLLSQSKYEAYTATTPTDWNGTPPANVGAALDRIAAALNALGHKP